MNDRDNFLVAYCVSIKSNLSIIHQNKKACENWYYTLKEDNEREYDITEIYIDFNDSAR